MSDLPQLTPRGSTFAYNNAAVAVAGRVRKGHRHAYETAAQELVLDPLRLRHTRFFTDELVGYSIAAPHVVQHGKAVLDPPSWYMPRTLNPTGGLISSARDQLRWARLPPRARPATRRPLHPEPGVRAGDAIAPRTGGTLFVEVKGTGVT